MTRVGWERVWAVTLFHGLLVWCAALIAPMYGAYLLIVGPQLMGAVWLGGGLVTAVGVFWLLLRALDALTERALAALGPPT